MKHLDKNKVIAVVLITLLSGALLVYTATRTLHLIESTLPADQKVLAWFALAAFDLGLPLWTAYTLWGARGAWQRGIAALMVFTSLLGVVIAFGGDTLIQAEAQGVTVNLASAETVRWIIYGTVGIIGLNIVAVTMVHITDPDALRNERTESANDKLLTAELEHMAENAETLAADIAPVRAFAWRVKREQELLADLPPEIRAQYMRSGGLLEKPQRADDSPTRATVRAFAQQAPTMPRTRPAGLEFIDVPLEIDGNKYQRRDDEWVDVWYADGKTGCIRHAEFKAIHSANADKLRAQEKDTDATGKP